MRRDNDIINNLRRTDAGVLPIFAIWAITDCILHSIFPIDSYT